MNEYIYQHPSWFQIATMVLLLALFIIHIRYIKHYIHKSNILLEGIQSTMQMVKIISDKKQWLRPGDVVRIYNKMLTLHALHKVEHVADGCLQEIYETQVKTLHVSEESVTFIESL